MIVSKYASLTTRTLLHKAAREAEIAVSTGPDKQIMEIEAEYQPSGLLEELVGALPQAKDEARVESTKAGVLLEVEVKYLKLHNKIQHFHSARISQCQERELDIIGQ